MDAAHASAKKALVPLRTGGACVNLTFICLPTLASPALAPFLPLPRFSQRCKHFEIGVGPFFGGDFMGCCHAYHFSSRRPSLPVWHPPFPLFLLLFHPIFCSSPPPSLPLPACFRPHIPSGGEQEEVFQALLNGHLRPARVLRLQCWQQQPPGEGGRFKISSRS